METYTAPLTAEDRAILNWQAHGLASAVRDRLHPRAALTRTNTYWDAFVAAHRVREFDHGADVQMMQRCAWADRPQPSGVCVGCRS